MAPVATGLSVTLQSYEVFRRVYRKTCMRARVRFRRPLTPNSFFSSMLQGTGWVGTPKLTLSPGAWNRRYATAPVQTNLRSADSEMLFWTLWSCANHSESLTMTFRLRNAVWRKLYPRIYFNLNMMRFSFAERKNICYLLQPQHVRCSFAELKNIYYLLQP